MSAGKPEPLRDDRWNGAGERPNALARRIAGMAETVQRNPAHLGVLSTGEALAVALVLDRADLLPPSYTTLEAVQRVVGGAWSLATMLEAQHIVRAHGELESDAVARAHRIGDRPG